MKPEEARFRLAPYFAAWREKFGMLAGELALGFFAPGFVESAVAGGAKYIVVDDDDVVEYVRQTWLPRDSFNPSDTHTRCVVFMV